MNYAFAVVSKNLSPNLWSHRFLLCFPLEVLCFAIYVYFYSRLWVKFSGKCKVYIYFFAYGCLNVPATFIEKTMGYPMNCLSFVKDQLSICMWFYFLIYTVPFIKINIYLSVFDEELESMIKRSNESWNPCLVLNVNSSIFFFCSFYFDVNSTQ